MIIDGHAHACGEFLEPENIIRAADIAGVDKIVLTAGEKGSRRTYALPDMGILNKDGAFDFAVNGFLRVISKVGERRMDFDSGNTHVANLASKHPDRILQFLWVDPEREGLTSYLDRHHDLWQFKGVKVHQCWHPFGIFSQGFRELCQWTGKMNLPLFIHPGLKEDIIDLIRFIPTIKSEIIVGHLIGLEMFMEAFTVAPANLWFDCSCPDLTGSERILKAVSHFGASHILMGSDTPYGKNNLKRSVERIRDLPLTETEKNQILGGNLGFVLNL